MPDQHLIARCERASKSLGQINGAVLTTGTADRDRQIIAVVARVIGEPARDEVLDIGVHSLDFGSCFEELYDSRLFARQRS